MSTPASAARPPALSPEVLSSEESATPRPALPSHVEHLVIGAGFGGLGAVIGLHEDGEDDVLVVEKAPDLGGTWRANTYPGAACDVPSQLYSFSFAPNPDWSMSFSPQPEIQAYLQRVAASSGLLHRFSFDTEVLDATWLEDQQRWQVTTSRGVVLARYLISCAGGLSEPRLPEIEGLESFRGELFHSADWDHSADLRGKRVAVIGTGASAIQIIPQLQPVVGHLDVYQRTAPWVIPRNDRRYTRAEKFAFRHVPGVMKAYRTGIYWGRELYVPAFAWQPRLAAPARRAAELNIRLGIKDPALREAVTPTFAIGCKRILISNTYYPALAADNTELVTDAITAITPTGIVTGGGTSSGTGSGTGTERAVDAIVVATGFHVTDHPVAQRITGRHGESLAQAWSRTGQRAYKGTTVPGFPNFFMVVGPNTTLGHSSMVFVIESQLAYLRRAVAAARVNGYATMEPREDATDEWNADLQRRMGRTVWNSGGCASWYLDEHGRNTTVWPRNTFTLRRLLAAFDPAAYELGPARPVQAGPEIPETLEVGA